MKKIFTIKDAQLLIVAERVRIWQTLFKHASVRVWRDGNKDSRIISIGDKKLEEIILPPLPKDFIGYPEGSDLVLSDGNLELLDENKALPEKS